jgi:fructoselysine-6-P-deglycase FrlB-like protein
VAAAELADDHRADVVAMTCVLATRIAEPDDEQVERRGAFASAPREAH